MPCFDNYIDCVEFNNGEKVPKSDFKEEKSRKEVREPFVKCASCLRDFHQICVGFNDQIDDSFYCRRCLKKKKNLKMKEHKFLNPRKLPETECSRHLERSMRKYLIQLREKDRDIEDVINSISIRVLSNKNTVMLPKPEFSTFNNSEYIYRDRTIFVFQRIPEGETLFFGIHLHMFSDAVNPESNLNYAYLAYMDSIQMIENTEVRRGLYQSILLAVFDYLAFIGYKRVYIWMCPPKKGDDYIFHSKPPNQKNLQQFHLRSWYLKLFALALSYDILVQYLSILEDLERQDQISVLKDVPYFEGDLWCTKIEECLMICHKEANDKALEPLAEVSFNFYYF